MLLSGTTMKGSFQMGHFWSNRFLAFQGRPIEAKNVLFCWGILTTLRDATCKWKIWTKSSQLLKHYPMIHALMYAK
jgi:hypothetical protein